MLKSGWRGKRGKVSSEPNIRQEAGIIIEINVPVEWRLTFVPDWLSKASPEPMGKTTISIPEGRDVILLARPSSAIDLAQRSSLPIISDHRVQAKHLCRLVKYPSRLSVRLSQGCSWCSLKDEKMSLILLAVRWWYQPHAVRMLDCIVSGQFLKWVRYYCLLILIQMNYQEDRTENSVVLYGVRSTQKYLPYLYPSRIWMIEWGFLDEEREALATWKN